MALDSEAIFDALTTRLRESLAGTVRSVERRRRPQYTEVELPCVVVADDEGQEALASAPDDPAPIWVLGCDVEVYARTVETDASPTTQLNDLVRAIRTALEFSVADDASALYGGRMEHYTSLGGRVRALAITRVEKGMGALTGKPTAQLTLTMEALG
jgi:hypothetical protein